MKKKLLIVIALIGMIIIPGKYLAMTAEEYYYKIVKDDTML